MAEETAQTAPPNSKEQPEEFPFENVIADYADKLVEAFSGSTYSRILWVNPSGSEAEFKRSTFLNKIDINAPYDIKQDLDRLTQLQLAAITPVVQLYRRDYSGESLDKYKDRLFMFNNVYPSNTSISDVNSGAQSREQFLNSSLIGVDSGNPVLMSNALTNVDYTFAGRNPVESERSIDITLNMKFASFEALVGKSTTTLNMDTDLVGMQKGKPSEYPIDNTDYTDAGGTKNAQGVTKNFLSLITHPPSDTQLEEYALENKVYNPSKFRVYLKFGWRVINADIDNKKVFDDSFKDFIESINAGKHDKGLLLNLINHELTFNEEGEIELKVNYIGSADTSLTNGDTDFIKALYLIRMDKLRKEVADEKQSDAAIKALEQLNKWSNRGCEPKVVSDDPIDKKMKQLDGIVQEKKEELVDKKQESINKIYSEFIASLVDATTKNPENIKLLEISLSQLESYSSAMSNEQRPSNWIEDVIKNDPFGTQGNKGKDAAQSDTQVVVDASNNQKAEDAGNTTKWFGADITSVKKLATKATLDPYGPNIAGRKQIFKFTNVGSLIDGLLISLIASLNNGKLSNDKEQKTVTEMLGFIRNLSIILGDFYFYPRGGKPVLLPIAKIPINFDSFLVWYTDNIITKQRKNYVLKDFLTDFFTGLVIPTLNGYDSAGKIGRQYSVSFDQRQIRIKAYRDSMGAATVCKANADRSIDNLIVDEYKAGSVAASTAKDSQGNDEQVKDYTVIFISLKVTDPDARGRKFTSVSEDREESISHFWVGDTKGMIKSIKFKRIEQPGLKEAKATKEAFIPLNQLRDLYNTDISMFGNHYYYPGDMIFIHPQNSILGEPWQTKPRSISNIMGIGGYYDVIKVSSHIGEGGYETNLECIWTCSGEEFTQTADEKQAECKKIAAAYVNALSGSGVDVGNSSESDENAKNVSVLKVP